MDFLQNKLLKRAEEGSLRSLSLSDGIDFWSNDYLGLARVGLNTPPFHSGTRPDTGTAESVKTGSTGSRLISGNSAQAEEAEIGLARFFHAEAGLIFNSGYDANLGLFSCVPGRNDTVLYDEFIHASVRDGMRLGLAKSYAFAHNDLSALEKRLKTAAGNVFVAIESLYSMDGDEAPLRQIADLCRTYGAYFIVDEAHAGGIYGVDGTGLCNHTDIESECFARIVTFGKAYGSHGAIVLGSETLKQYLVNFARSFIYTTALPPKQYTHILQRVTTDHSVERQKLFEVINYYCQKTGSELKSPVQTIHFNSVEACSNAAELLNQKGFAVKAIFPPTVPSPRLRICLHAFNTFEEIDGLTTIIDLFQQLS